MVSFLAGASFPRRAYSRVLEAFQTASEHLVLETKPAPAARATARKHRVLACVTRSSGRPATSVVALPPSSAPAVCRGNCLASVCHSARREASERTRVVRLRRFTRFTRLLRVSALLSGARELKRRPLAPHPHPRFPNAGRANLLGGLLLIRHWSHYKPVSKPPDLQLGVKPDCSLLIGKKQGRVGGHASTLTRKGPQGLL